MSVTRLPPLTDRERDVAAARKRLAATPGATHRVVPPLTDFERDAAAAALLVAAAATLVLVALGLGMTRPSRRRIARWERRLKAETVVYVMESNDRLSRRWEREDAAAAKRAAASPAETGSPACP